jgi:hypothetical protein
MRRRNAATYQHCAAKQNARLNLSQAHINESNA